MEIVRSLTQLEALALQKRSVIMNRQPRPVPAAFVMGMPANLVLNLLRRNDLTVYQKPKRVKPKHFKNRE